LICSCTPGGQAAASRSCGALLSVVMGRQAIRASISKRAGVNKMYPPGLSVNMPGFLFRGERPASQAKQFAPAGPYATVCSTTWGSIMSEHIAADLGDLEREALQLVWRLGAATAEQVRAELKRPLKESTVRTVLRRLEDKG